jgi:hypothetical protein
MDPFISNACAVVVNERIRYNRNYNLVAQAFLNHPFADMNTFDVPYFPPLVEVELNKTVLERFSRQEPVMGVNNIFQNICVVPLDAFFPGDVFHAILERLVKIIYIRNAAEIIIKTDAGLLGGIALRLPPLIPRLPAFRTCHESCSNFA